MASSAKKIPLTVWRGTAIAAISVIWVWSSVYPLWVTPSDLTITNDEKLGAPSALNPNHHSQQRQAAAIDIKKLKAIPLFGDAKATPSIELKPVEQPIAAVESKLSLKLSGIVSSSDPKAARAIITHQHKQKLYALGDKLPGGHQVSLERILSDRVILSNAGNYESLPLFEDKGQTAASKPWRSATKKNKSTNIAKQTNKLNKAQNTASTGKPSQGRAPITTLADVIKITVAREGNNIIGYRVRPGRQHQLFDQFGFEANDVITHVNGISVDDASKAMSVYREIRSQQSARFNLIRNGQPLNLDVELSTPHEDGNA